MKTIDPELHFARHLLSMMENGDAIVGSTPQSRATRARLRARIEQMESLPTFPLSSSPTFGFSPEGGGGQGSQDQSMCIGTVARASADSPPSHPRTSAQSVVKNTPIL